MVDDVLVSLSVSGSGVKFEVKVFLSAKEQINT